MLKDIEPVWAGYSQGRNVDLGGLIVSDLRFPAGLRLSPHEHEVATIGVTLEGSVETALGASKRYSSPLNTVITKPPGERHANRIDEVDARLIIISAAPLLADGELRCCKPALLEVVHGRDQRAGVLARSVARELAAPDDVTPLAVGGLVRELLASIARHREARREGHGARWLRRSLDYIHAHAADAIGLAEVAREAGVHPVYFARAFRAQTGLPVGAYLRKLRVDRAAERLASTNLRIADIALEAGFSDQSHLTRVFRALTGMTPATYRQRRRS
jgi:AraC family transcriptional regulator